MTDEDPKPWQPLRDAAKRLRDGQELDAETVQAVADWLDSEAIIMGEMEPFAVYINAVVKQATGIETYISFGRKPDGGIAMHGDTSPAALTVAELINMKT